jgi:hypothetical protein
VLTLLPEAVWNSVLSVSNEDRSFLGATLISTRRSHSVSLCGLPLCGWAVVAPRHFHFTITALAVDRAAQAGQGGILWQCHTELFSRAILLSMFVYGDFTAVCSILYTWQQRVWLECNYYTVS